MFLFDRVKRFQHISDLILEADIIKFGDLFNDLGSDYDPNKKKIGTSDEDPNFQTWDKLDYLIDQLIERRIVDLDQDLARPIYEKQFGSQVGKDMTEAYLIYCKSRINRLREQISQEISAEYPDKEKIAQLSRTTIMVAARIEALDRIYAAFKNLNQEELDRIANEIGSKITEVKSDLTSTYLEPVTAISGRIKTDLTKIENSKTPENEKMDSARKVMDDFSILDKAIANYPPEIKDGAARAKNKAAETIKRTLGEEAYNKIVQEIITNDREAQILRRILDLRHMNFTKEEQIYAEADNIKISINGLNSARAAMQSRPEVISYLEKTLAEELEEVLRRAKEKNLAIEKAKGIHFDFNTRLKLHEATDLPVTGKQIADASWIMRARRKLAAIILLLPAGERQLTAAGQAFANFGEQTHKAYAVVLNSAAKFIGKAIKGREGEMKADAISRYFIPSPDVLDAKPNPITAPAPNPVAPPQRVMEDAGAPGVSMQVPGSIGSMGPIVAPTRSSPGSGDKFIGQNIHKTKKKKRKKTVYEDNVQILNFADFLKENKL